MLAATVRSTWWPMLKMRYGFTDAQIRPYGFSTFVNDDSAISQGVITEGPYLAWIQGHKKVRSFHLPDLGYDPYAGVLTVSQRLIDSRPAAVQCLVDGSRRGWADYMRDPAPAFAEILRITPEVSRGLLEFGFKVMREHHLAESPDTDRLGIGAMTPERWRDHARLLIRAGLLPANFDVEQSYDLRFQQTAAAQKSH